MTRNIGPARGAKAFANGDKVQEGSRLMLLQSQTPLVGSWIVPGPSVAEGLRAKKIVRNPVTCHTISDVAVSPVRSGPESPGDPPCQPSLALWIERGINP